MANTREFDFMGHHYVVTPIEGSDDEFIIIRDGRNTRRINAECAKQPMLYVNKLFKEK